MKSEEEVLQLLQDAQSTAEIHVALLQSMHLMFIFFSAVTFFRSIFFFKFQKNIQTQNEPTRQ